jgi:hypothetical protein
MAVARYNASGTNVIVRKGKSSMVMELVKFAKKDMSHRAVESSVFNMNQNSLMILSGQEMMSLRCLLLLLQKRI